ncbi:MAG: cupin [Coxiella sp. (in: Bacteria)]|nr:MAG: cupin [Coxiella sp. (in: g-proteobacteria)]
MKTKEITKQFEHMSPAGAEVRLLMNNEYGGMAQCTLLKNIISKPVRHKTVSEFWYVLSGSGQIWRKNNSSEEVTELTTGVSIDIPLGTDFQYRSGAENLVFICVTMPPWSGADEAEFVKQGTWAPTVE